MQRRDGVAKCSDDPSGCSRESHSLQKLQYPNRIKTTPCLYIVILALLTIYSVFLFNWMVCYFIDCISIDYDIYLINNALQYKDQYERGFEIIDKNINYYMNENKNHRGNRVFFGKFCICDFYRLFLWFGNPIFNASALVYRRIVAAFVTKFLFAFSLITWICIHSYFHLQNPFQRGLPLSITAKSIIHSDGIIHCFMEVCHSISKWMNLVGNI